MSDHFFVYIVQCSDQTLYTGYTNDLAQRIKTHNSGKGAKYTKTRRPVTLVYFEEFTDDVATEIAVKITAKITAKIAAQKREYQLKQLTRAQKLALIAAASRPLGVSASAPKIVPAPTPVTAPISTTIPPN